MRPLRRAIQAQQRHMLPERSRLTLGGTMAALRHSREALTDIEVQLEDLLTRVRNPETLVLDSAAPDRLAVARAQASEAMASLHPLHSLFG